jgi:phage baseplate assembly protein gpV
MGGFADEIKETAAEAAKAAAPENQLGEVLGVDQADFKVRVRLQPSGIETDWLRVAAPLFHWAEVTLPEKGDEVLVMAAASELIVLAALFNAIDKVPSGAKESARKGDECSCSAETVGDHGTHSHTVIIEEGTGKVKLVD